MPIRSITVPVAVEWLLCTIAGGLFPDVDIKSKGQKYFYRGMLIVLLTLIVQQRFDLLSLASLFSILPLLTKHRGLFHEIWFICLFTIAVWMLFSSLCPYYSEALCFDMIFFLVGALSHIWLDFYGAPTIKSVVRLLRRRLRLRL